jgi:valyl-tRNA synthetase
MEDMEKTYNPEFEQRIYKMWTDGRFFEAHPNPEKEPFTVMMPPPNITGQLHMGHALNQTLQDIVVRFKRMSGYEALWLPGTDHASIATEVKIVDKMRAEGLSKNDVGRDGFLERAWKWKEQYGGRIVEQLKRLGTSCDWSKEAFTMDDNCSGAVVEAFVKYYKKGLIYRGNRIINWCPCCKTALSDAEVDYQEQQSNLWYYNYPLEDGDGAITIATTRPETMLGDTAVAVNPKDPKMSKYIGKRVRLPLTDRVIPVVGDEYCEIGFGTGAVKITPAHDPNDFELGLRHNLPVIAVIGEDGLMNENAGKYRGMDRLSARKAIVEDLTALGLMVKIEPYSHNVGQCYRCGETVESVVSKQWFVKMKPLAEPAIKAVKSKKIEFIPKRFEKTYFNWMENIKDWCISRQLWWGHRIPAYYCDACGEMTVSKTPVEVCPKCGSSRVRQDEDVLDTWFSSALWPFSTLGFPKKNKNLSYFYPTNVLITAYDIIFFWVARMIFSGLEFMGEPPFSEVLIHGIVRDAQGRKMSKSLGNGIDPLELIDKYGADALRFSLASGIAPGSDTRFSETKIESARNFVNKLWNASRFVIMNIKSEDDLSFPTRLNGADKWILTRLNDVIKDVTINLNKYEVGLAAARLYDFTWSEFCDWYIEMSKPMLYGGDPRAHSHAIAMLVHVLTQILKMLHPFIPFITEEIYSKFAPKGSVLMVQNWPSYNKKYSFRKEEKSFEGLREIIVAIRNVRNEMNVAPSKRLSAYIVAKDEKFLASAAPYLEKLAGIENAVFSADKSEISAKVTSIVTHDAEILIPLGDLIDVEKERERIAAETEKTAADIKKTENLLSNADFVSKAPQKLVDSEKEKLAKLRDKLEKLADKMAMYA